MATLTINGQKVTVSDGFRDLPREEQEAIVKQIAGSIGGNIAPAPDEGQGWGDTILDVGKSAASGVARGAADLVGLPGTLGDMFNSGMSYITGLPELPKSPVSGQTVRGAASAVTGGATDYQPQTTAGEFASTAGEFIPGAIAFGGMSPQNIARYGILPGLASEGAGQLTEGTALEPWARVGAAMSAPMVPAFVQRMITPNAISPERLQAAQTLRAEGITPTAGQITGGRNLRAMESELGGNRTAQIMDDQATAFTDAAMRRAGGAGRATPDNMTAIRDRLSQGFDDISARNSVRLDQGIVADVNRARSEYMRVLPTEQRQIFQNLSDDIATRFRAGGGSMPGADYQTIRSRLSRMAQNNRNRDPEFAEAIRGLRNALDDGMARSVAPDDAAEWARLRREYGNMKVLEKAATGAGENAALGTISPAKLRQSAVAGRQGQYARGEGDFDQLARAGEALLRPLPDSGTATRLNARTLGGIMGAGGAGTGALVNGPGGAVAGALLGMAAPTVAGHALMSRPVQAYLANQLLQPTRLADQRSLSVVEALISQAADGRLTTTR